MAIYYVQIGSLYSGKIYAQSGHIAIITACKQIPSLSAVYSAYKCGMSIRKCMRMLFHLYGGCAHAQLV